MQEAFDRPRIAVIGPSSSGKTEFSRRLARQLDHPHIELDALYWGPDWTPAEPDEFRRQVTEATAQPHWVCDGNYAMVRDVVWSRATVVVWLNYSFPCVFSRAVRRAVRRIVTREELFGGNREQFNKTFLSRDSILLWVITSFRRVRRDYRDLYRSGEYGHVERIEISHPREADVFLDACRPAPHPAADPETAS